MATQKFLLGKSGAAVAQAAQGGGRRTIVWDRRKRQT